MSTATAGGDLPRIFFWAGIKAVPDDLKLFRFLCKEDNIEIAKLVYNRIMTGGRRPNQNNFPENSVDETRIHRFREMLFDVFLTACKRGQVALAQWLYEKRRPPLVKYEIETICEGACTNGHLKLLQWILSLYYSFSERNPQWFPKWFPQWFDAAFVHGHWDLVEWLRTFPAAKEYCPSIGFYIDQKPWLLAEVCQTGCLVAAECVVQRHRETGNPVPQSLYKRSFEGACNKGQVEMARWVHRRFPETITASFAMEVLMAGHCVRHEPVVMFLISTFGIGPHRSVGLHCVKQMVYTALAKGSLRMLQYAQTLCADDQQLKLEDNHHHTFRSACRQGWLDIAQWVYDHDENITRNTLLGALTYAIQFGQASVVQWLGTLTAVPDLILFHRNILLNEACSHGTTTFVRLLENACPKLFVGQQSASSSGKKHQQWIFVGVFLTACLCSETLELLEYLWAKYPYFDDHGRILVSELLKACRRGNLTVAKWLFERLGLCGHTICVTVSPDEVADVFTTAYTSGNLHVAEWMYSICSALIDEATNHQNFFRMLCANKQGREAAFLAKLFPDKFAVVIRRSTGAFVSGEVVVTLPIQSRPAAAGGTHSYTMGLQCLICYEPVSKASGLETKCGHIYCRMCVSKWYDPRAVSGLMGPNCPYCRQSVRVFYPVGDVSLTSSESVDDDGTNGTNGANGNGESKSSDSI
jgi:hypothetical protein